MTEIVTVVGSANIDTVVHVTRMPQPGETIGGHRIERRPGGKGANQAVAAAAAGATTRLIAAFGTDELGHTYRAALGARLVDTSASMTADEATGEAIITVDDDGENSIVIVAGANAALDPDTAVANLGSAGWVLLQLEIDPRTVRAVIHAARRRNMKVALNASPIIPEAEEFALLSDLVVVNQHEAEQLPGVPDMCVTRGAGTVSWGDETITPAPVRAVDTTGAGDAFAGTLVAAVAAGKSRRDALVDAVRASGVVVQHEGAQPWRF